MAYMRGDPYIYQHVDGGLHIHSGAGSVILDWERVEELAAMIWLEMDDEQRKAAMERAAHEHGGNFGADAVRSALNLKTVMGMLREEVTRGSIEKELGEVYTPEGVQIWLTSKHKLLGDERPWDLLERGEGERVLAVVRQLVEGAHV